MRPAHRVTAIVVPEDPATYRPGGALRSPRAQLQFLPPAGHPRSSPAGMWYHRALEYEAQRQAERRADRQGADVEQIDRDAFMQPYELKLAPLSCWSELPTAAIRKKVAEMMRSSRPRPRQALAFQGELPAVPAFHQDRRGIRPRGRCRRIGTFRSVAGSRELSPFTPRVAQRECS